MVVGLPASNCMFDIQLYENDVRVVPREQVLISAMESADDGAAIEVEVWCTR